MTSPLTTHQHSTRPRKVVSLNNNHHFIGKRNQLNPNIHSFSSSSIPTTTTTTATTTTTSRLSNSINHPIKAKIKLSPAINRPSASPSASPNPVSITRPSVTSHQLNSTSSVITARVVKSSKALHQISSRPNSPFRSTIPHNHKDIILSPNITQRSSTSSRSRANTHSDQCLSQFDSDCFSSASSTSANADGGSELSRTHPLWTSTRSKSIQQSNHHLSPLNIDLNHHQTLKISSQTPSKDESTRPSLTHQISSQTPSKDESTRPNLTHINSNLTSSELSPSLAPPVNLVNRHTNSMNEITRTRDLSSDSPCDSSSNQQPTSNTSTSTTLNSKTGCNETWTNPNTTNAKLTLSHDVNLLEQKEIMEEDWEVLNDQEEEKDSEEQMKEKINEVEEIKEDEARVNRKILDLEISNSSLLAINARLERTKLKQTNEIRELRKKLRERSIGGRKATSILSYQTEEGFPSGPEESETENSNLQETLKIENLMKEDLKFSEAIRVLESLINRANDALIYQVGEKDLHNKKVLNRVQIEIGEGEGEEEEENENENLTGDLSRSVSLNEFNSDSK